MTTWTIDRAGAQCETEYHGAFRVRRIDLATLNHLAGSFRAGTPKQSIRAAHFLRRLNHLAAAGLIRLYDFR